MIELDDIDFNALCCTGRHYYQRSKSNHLWQLKLSRFLSYDLPVSAVINFHEMYKNYRSAKAYERIHLAITDGYLPVVTQMLHACRGDYQEIMSDVLVTAAEQNNVDIFSFVFSQFDLVSSRYDVPVVLNNALLAATHSKSPSLVIVDMLLEKGADLTGGLIGASWTANNRLLKHLLSRSGLNSEVMGMYAAKACYSEDCSVKTLSIFLAAGTDRQRILTGIAMAERCDLFAGLLEREIYKPEEYPLIVELLHGISDIVDAPFFEQALEMMPLTRDQCIAILEILSKQPPKNNRVHYQIVFEKLEELEVERRIPISPSLFLTLLDKTPSVAMRMWGRLSVEFLVQVVELAITTDNHVLELLLDVDERLLSALSDESLTTALSHHSSASVLIIAGAFLFYDFSACRTKIMRKLVDNMVRIYHSEHVLCFYATKAPGLARYLLNHPDLKRNERLIEDLEKKLSAEAKRRMGANDVKQLKPFVRAIVDCFPAILRDLIMNVIDDYDTEILQLLLDFADLDTLRWALSQLHRHMDAKTGSIDLFANRYGLDIYPILLDAVKNSWYETVAAIIQKVTLTQRQKDRLKRKTDDALMRKILDSKYYDEEENR